MTEFDKLNNDIVELKNQNNLLLHQNNTLAEKEKFGKYDP